MVHVDKHVYSPIFFGLCDWARSTLCWLVWLRWHSIGLSLTWPVMEGLVRVFLFSWLGSLSTSSIYIWCEFCFHSYLHWEAVYCMRKTREKDSTFGVSMNIKIKGLGLMANTCMHLESKSCGGSWLCDKKI